MTAPARSLPLSLAVAEAAPRCQDELVVGAETNYALMSQVQGLAFDRTVPLNVSLELTLNCNIRCLHCYNLDRDLPQGACHDRSGAPDTRPDLSLERIDVIAPTTMKDHDRRAGAGVAVVDANRRNPGRKSRRSEIEVRHE